MIYKYNSKRAKLFKTLMFSIPKRHQASKIIFSYGDTAFKFIYKNYTIEVSRYDEEIILRKLK